MTVPTAATYDPVALIAGHTALLALIDGAATAGKIRFRDALDVLLGDVPLDDPGGVVNGTTGQLTLTIAGDDQSADANGTAAYAEICDGDNTVIVSIPVTDPGVAAVSGYVVLNTLTIVAGLPIAVISATIG